MILLTASTSGSQNPASMIIMLVAMFAIMYFVMIRPQKKRQKEEQEMRNAVEVGDDITTIGGICGKIVVVKENHLIIETGADRNRMQITRWAVQSNNTANERLQAEREAAKAAAEKAKAEKKAAKSKKKED
ncbi:MAG: preprotein translocase subunit YajC [Oscillospiraceae bacterium]|nr:preprotein translocase subunit YajC [Oscillospiraceae bacterium]MDD6147197.1 preprotein translocase subunit YajC [Oscillospiraceae bacterium]